MQHLLDPVELMGMDPLLDIAGVLPVLMDSDDEFQDEDDQYEQVYGPKGNSGRARFAGTLGPQPSGSV